MDSRSTKETEVSENDISKNETESLGFMHMHDFNLLLIYTFGDFNFIMPFKTHMCKCLN